MNIVHYFIGIPPIRHGGAPSYALDLLMGQAKCKDIHVSILVPGETLRIGKKAVIKFAGNFRGISCYEISNPVIEPLLYGIRKAEYILEGERYFEMSNIREYFENVKPDIIHVHTLMGLPIAFLIFMKDMGVKFVYTSHDYYGICPRVNLVNKFGHICNNASGIFCDDCNKSAKKRLFLQIVNSNLFLKGKWLLPRNIIKRQGHRLPVQNMPSLSFNNSSQFIKLHSHYQTFFSQFDAIHFNSYVSRDVFAYYMKLPYNEVIPITTNSIYDRRQIKNFNNDVRISFIAGLGAAKGFPMLKRVLTELYDEGYKNWNLNVWEDGKKETDSCCENIEYRGRFSKDELHEVYDFMDLLVVPSIWKETFSLVALEAISFGVPVLMSDNVGAKLLIKDDFPDFIFHSEEELKRKMRDILIDTSLLARFNKKIVLTDKINFSEDKHVSDINDFYRKVLRK